MSRNPYEPPSTPGQDGRPSRKGVWARRVLLLFVATLILPVGLFIAHGEWRARNVLAFCKAAQPQIAFSESLALEKRHGIDDSYLVQTRFEDYVDQAHSLSLEFRSQMLDPDFACLITHDGQSVNSVQLLTLQGFDPK